jgi:ligand-binding SRPBCC domain-containing protein
MRILNEQVSLTAPQSEVWAVLEDFGGVAKWAPNMRRSKLVGSQATGSGARRIMHHHLGFNFEEVITEWNQGTGYSFEVYRAPYPMKNVRENWSLTHHNGQSLVSTQVSYDMSLSLLGRWLDGLLVRHIVRREMRAGLSGLKRYVEKATAGLHNKPPSS